MIYTAGDLTIKLEGTNTLTATEVDSSRTNCGIYAEGETATLTIQGDGLNDKLIVDLGDTTSTASNGIYVVANLSVKNCFIDITGGNGTGTSYGQFCCGIRVNGSLYSVRITDSIVNCTAGSSSYFSCGLYADQPQEIIITNSVVNATGATGGFSASTCHKFELRNSTLNGTANGSTAATGINIYTYRGSPLGTLELYSGTFKGSSQNYNPDGDYKGGIFINGDVNGHNPSGAKWQTWGDESGTFKVIDSSGAYWSYYLGKTSAFICEPLYAVSQNATGDGSGTVALTVDGKALDGGKTTARSWVDVVITPAMGSGVKNVSVSNGAYIEQVEESQNRYRFFMPNSNVTVTVEYELLAPLFDPQSGNPLILGGGDIEAGYTAPTDDPSNSDYTFEGWFTQPNGGGDKVESGYTAGTTYYAHWTKDGQTVYTTGLDFTAENTPPGGSDFAWDPANNTLTLRGLYVDSLDDFGLKLPDGATVFLADDSKNFISGGDSAGNTYGIYSAGAYTLVGTGELTVIAGDSTGGNSCGLYGTVTQNGGSVTVTSGAVSGDDCTSTAVENLTLNGGTMEATGGKATGNNGTSYGALHVTLNGGMVTSTGGNVASGTSCGAYEVTVGADGLLTAVAGEAATQKGIDKVNPGSANPGVYFSESGDERDLTNFSYEASDPISAPNNLAKITFAPALDLSGTKSFEYTAGENTPTITVTPARLKDSEGNPVTKIGETVYRLYKIETNGTETPVANKSGAVTYSDQGVGSITDLDISGLTPGDYVLKVTTADPTDSSKRLEGGMKLSIAKKAFDEQNVNFDFDFEAPGATVTPPVYNGSKYEPDVIIMDGAYQLKEGTDYDLIYGDNTNAGEGTGSVTVKLKGNYSGEFTQNFTIAPKTLDKENVTSTLVPVMDGETLTFTGGIKWGNIELVEGEDYDINVTRDSQDSTKADISIVFKGNYANIVDTDSNPVPLAYEDQIIRTLVKDDMFAFEVSDLVYSGSEIKPTVTPSNADLKEGTHYTVSYENNVGAGEGKIIITGITENGFTGTVEKTFTIAKAEQAAPDVAKLTIVAESVKNKGDGSISGLTNKMEYSADGGNTWETITDTKLAGLAPGTYQIRYKADDNHNVGPVSTVTITASEVMLTVKFNLNGGTGEVPDQTFIYGAKVTDVPVAPTRNGYTFIDWTLKDGTAWVFGENGSAVTDNVTLYAKWVRTGFHVSGVVKDSAEEPVVGATITAKQGNLIYDVKLTDSNGIYSFENVPAGTYNLVVDHEGKTVTSLVVVAADGRVDDIVLPEEKVSSKVEIVPGTPNIMVGGLDAEAAVALQAAKNDPDNAGRNITSVTVDMSVEAKLSEAVDPVVKEKIEEQAASQSQNLTFVDIDITQITYIDNVEQTPEAIRETSDLLTFIIPFETAGRRDFKVFRYHIDERGEENVHPLTTTPDESTGEYIEAGNGEIIVHAKFFSTYAIGFSKGSSTSGGTIPGDIIPGGTTSADSVSSPKTENGTVTLSSKNPAVGSTVTVTVMPDEGYELDFLTVTDSTGKAIELTDNGDGTYSFKMPTGNVTVKAVFCVAGTRCSRDYTCPIWPYTDAKTTAWYHDGVHYCIENGLMNGISTTQFAPNGTTTRAQIVTILWRLEGEPYANYAMGFTDVAAGKWYTEAVRWAASENIVGGYSATSFGPNDAITREQFAAILWRYCQYKGIDVSVGEETNILSYSDAFDIHSWAMSAMQWACGAGVIGGMSDGNGMKLDPTGTATRAQVATMLQRFCTEIME